MIVYVILYGCASKPELSDDIMGYTTSKEEAQTYCDHKNRFAPDGYVYFWEETNRLEV